MVALVAVGVMWAPGVSSSGTSAPTCLGSRATIVGNAKSNTLRGTPKADVIVSLAGNDKIFGLGGNDKICAGSGNDTIYGGPGKGPHQPRAGNGKGFTPERNRKEGD